MNKSPQVQIPHAFNPRLYHRQIRQTQLSSTDTTLQDRELGSQGVPIAPRSISIGFEDSAGPDFMEAFGAVYVLGVMEMIVGRRANTLQISSGGGAKIVIGR